MGKTQFANISTPLQYKYGTFVVKIIQILIQFWLYSAHRGLDTLALARPPLTSRFERVDLYDSFLRYHLYPSLESLDDRPTGDSNLSSRIFTRRRFRHPC